MNYLKQTPPYQTGKDATISQIVFTLASFRICEFVAKNVYATQELRRILCTK